MLALGLGSQSPITIGACIAVMLATPAMPQTTVARESVPVVIKAEPDKDACATGTVEGLSVDGFLSVRSGPGTSFAEEGRLSNKDLVHWCAEDGDWVGIVYPLGANCGVSTSWQETGPYQGPCKSGWAHRRWLRPLAG